MPDSPSGLTRQDGSGKYNGQTGWTRRLTGAMTQEMSQFRQLLKQSIAGPHKRLEDLAVMKVYSNGNASLDQYLAVTEGLYEFWINHQPRTDRLPNRFHQFYSRYLSALEQDVGERRTAHAKTPVNEIAFFYVLLGSGLGARVIRQRYQDNTLPQKNIDHLAQNSAPLWKTFIAEQLNTVPESEHGAITGEAHHLFTTLYNNIVTI